MDSLGIDPLKGVFYAISSKPVRKNTSARAKERKERKNKGMKKGREGEIEERKREERK